MHKNTINSVLAVSLGDPAGISPEIVSKNLDLAVRICRPIVFGHWPSLRQAVEKITTDVEIDLAEKPTIPEPGHVTVVDCGPGDTPIDTPDSRASHAQWRALEQATDAVMSGICDALVTAPVAKKLIAELRPGFSGHTEYLAKRARVSAKDVTMVFASLDLVVGLVSTHLPMRDAPSALSRPRLERTTRHLVELLARLKPDHPPRIGVAALNPHAGENGLIGTEEIEIIEPFCRDLERNSGIELVGPLPADALFRDALQGEYDGVVAAYHDQAMIPLRLLGVGRTVNVTMGLPFVRTSPDHGVAYDIARTGAANPAGMRLALELGAKLTGGFERSLSIDDSSKQ
ncbi:MAG: 4-hydroxythreonine-4-phosphate dehydrogenase PdxA [Deltaproteobacteria bacterium]|nr:4-hydroxythreonine-4-phosphate dehydrogenase PdxA [Deltaproteobacteria bacterium]